MVLLIFFPVNNKINFGVPYALQKFLHQGSRRMKFQGLQKLFIYRYLAHIFHLRETHGYAIILLPQNRHLIQYNHAEKHAFVSILEDFVTVYIYSSCRIYVGKNKSCAQYFAICKLETCKSSLQKVIQFTLAKKKHKLQHSEIVFLMQDLIRTNPDIFRWIMLKDHWKKVLCIFNFFESDLCTGCTFW